MKFVDSCSVDIYAGNGGNGAVAFRREKYIPFGGPAGGDGGKGGDVVFVADDGLSTLLDITYARALRAKHGQHGMGADCYGRGAEPMVVRVPVGTQVFDRESGDLLFDLDQGGVRVVIAKGGRGGRGNIHFATSFDRAPRRSEPGEPGEEKKVRLELKVMADVGLLGFPNVGKSTFIRACSAAKPAVADYPFTTLTPHLGVVRVGDEATFVLADIPGLIPGASDGAGLGHRFLKHVERCRALLHLVTLDFAEGRDPVSDYEALMKELTRFDPELAKRPQIVVMSKADLTEVREAFEGVKKKLAKKKVDIRLVSAATGEGIRELLIDLFRLVTGKATLDDWDSPVPAKVVVKPVPAPPAAKKAVAGATRSALVAKKTTLGGTKRALAGKEAPATAKKTAKASKKATRTAKKTAKAPKKATRTTKKAPKRARVADKKKTMKAKARGR